MNITDQARAEVVTLILERPIIAIELGLMSEEEFVALMHSTYRMLKRQSLISLASLDRRKRSYQDIIDFVNKAAGHGI